uniref:SAM domain-containing protein n=1 Tax=Meloidogyne enterolobii TaxID=390850 RepID=A0A6V7TVP2_MELEN|nr:unnamed protein product [Meloidogyne enterolobii]
MKELFENCCLGYTQNVQLLLFKMSKKQNSRRSPLKFFRFSPSNDDSHFSNPPTGWLCNLRQPNTLHTLLHLAALHGHKEIVQILIEKDKQLIKIKDRRGCLPLHLAAWNGHLNILEILLDCEPKSVNEVNNSLQTALHLAVQNGHGPSILFILKKNGNPKMRNAHQENSLDIAVRTGRANLCRLLLMHCPELSVSSTSECCSTTPTHLTKSYSTPIYPLHIAARIGNEDCLKVLLENGFDTKYLGTEGTAVHIAAINGNKNVLKILLDNEVNLPSPSINVKNIEGLTVFELLNKQLSIFGSSNEKRIHERVRSWEECRNIILKYSSKEKREQIVEKQNNNGDKKNLIPNGWIIQKSHPPCTTSSNSHSPKQKQPIRTDNKTITNTNIHNHSQAKSDCPNSTSADCPYQPLPEEIANKLENNQQKNINGFNYQNLPKRSLLYDNAPLSAAGRRKWQHNCRHPPNGSSSNSPLPRTEMTGSHCSNSSLPHPINREFSLSTTQKNNKESNNSINKEIEDDEGIRSLPVFSYNSITKLADSNKSSPESSEEKFPNQKQHSSHFHSSSTSSPSSPPPQLSEGFSLNNNFKVLQPQQQKYFTLPPPPPPPPPFSSFPSPSPSCSSGSTPHSRFHSMEGKGNNFVNNDKINNNNSISQQQLNDKQNEINNNLNKSNNNDDDGDEFRWKEIDEMLTAFQRNSFFQSNIENNSSSPPPPATIKNDLITNSKNPSKELIDSNQHKIINWLKIEVELEEELAVRIGYLLINNGFDCFEFLKGSLNTKFMTELGIERKSQLRICRCLDEPSTQICIPNALMFDSISDWLKALNLSELFSKFSKENITSIKDLINFKLNRNNLEKLGITKLGHIARIIRSIDMATTSNVDVSKEGASNTTNSISTSLLPSDNKLNNNLSELNATTSLSTISSSTTNNSITSSRELLFYIQKDWI